MWFVMKCVGGFLVFGVVDVVGELFGFVSWGMFCVFLVFKYMVEYSVYVCNDQCGCGFGEWLLCEVVWWVCEVQVYVLVGCIDVINVGSIVLYMKLGFVYVGMIVEVGFKFGCWFDVVFYQLKFEMLVQLVDG